MSARVNYSIRVPVRTKKGTDAPFVSYCELLDVTAQGNSEDESRQNLLEALKLFIETCYFARTLDKVLFEAGFEKLDGEDYDVASEGEDILEVPLELIAGSHGRQAACA